MVLVQQIIRAKVWVFGQIAEYGGDPSSIAASGHSAGAHLASHLTHLGSSTTAIGGALLLGGVYDLRPLKNSFLQAEIALTDEEIERYTPLDHVHDPACRVVLAVGEQETRPFHSHMAAYSAVLREQGVPVSVRVIGQTNHMTSVRDLGRPGTEAGGLLCDLLTHRSSHP